MINYDGLVQGDKLSVKYDTSYLENQGFSLKFALDPENPVYNQVIEDCQNKGLEYKVVDGNGRQKDIWIKNSKV